MSFSPPLPPPAPMSHVAHQQELMRVYREELQLQQRLKEQCRLLQCLAEAAVGMFSWWREGAAAAAAATTDSALPVAGRSPISEASMGSDANTGEFTLPSASSLLKLHSGMVFYSLGELLQLWSATTAPSDFGGNSEKGTDENASEAETMSQGGRDASRREVRASSYDPRRVNKSSDQHPPPWSFPTSIAVPVPQIIGGAGDVPHTPPPPLQLPTPAQLIRYRVLDAACPLPVTHRLLLGSVDADSFRLLLLWLMRLTKECAEAMLLCRPDRHVREVHMQSARIEGHRSSSASADDNRRPLRAVPTPAVIENEAAEPIGTKRPRPQDGGSLRCSDGSVVSESWNVLCASLIRVLSYLVAAAAEASPRTGSERRQSTEPLLPSLMSCMASAATSAALRADLRLFLAEVAEVRDTVLEVKQYCCVVDAQRDDTERALKRPRGESAAAAVRPPPPASVAGQGQPMAMSNMALLAHLAAIVDMQVRKYL
ncbi:hypothetical protein LMJF_16_1160 [Leishmania major strain Friedlin]|uniref:Uncharacterized protein n=1 Tax=Leishmania major TaxID=5664 RepID=Q4QEQ1_LEIMA|nr:hypothetical protein LMJF_16_1160 [Leishmania major strain Friedlin]CAG9572157.1 hypothetical_protein_-_conserved [Leishmania major strain Friedlin]CAJ03908.1 hypothetical protein LMJF_16_1160 [Leishmania major strain Friedlin]|eukprot:XP_001682197.1 hypothetical protein LMJF_16_1160 [Leishmania major strain Friedlin]